MLALATGMVESVALTITDVRRMGEGTLGKQLQETWGRHPTQALVVAIAAPVVLALGGYLWNINETLGRLDQRVIALENSGRNGPRVGNGNGVAITNELLGELKGKLERLDRRLETQLGEIERKVEGVKSEVDKINGALPFIRGSFNEVINAPFNSAAIFTQPFRAEDGQRVNAYLIDGGSGHVEIRQKRLPNQSDEQTERYIMEFSSELQKLDLAYTLSDIEDGSKALGKKLLDDEILDGVRDKLYMKSSFVSDVGLDKLAGPMKDAGFEPIRNDFLGRVENPVKLIGILSKTEWLK